MQKKIEYKIKISTFLKQDTVRIMYCWLQCDVIVLTLQCIMQFLRLIVIIGHVVILRPQKGRLPVTLYLSQKVEEIR